MVSAALDPGHLNIGDAGVQTFPADFYSYLMSNSSLLNSYPFLKTCYTAWGHGVPSVKVRVSALTADTYNTVTSPGLYTTAGLPTTSNPAQAPAPGSTAQGPAEPTPTPTQQSSVSPTRSNEGQASSTLPSQPTIPSSPLTGSASGAQNSQQGSKSVAHSSSQPTNPVDSPIAPPASQPSGQSAKPPQSSPNPGSTTTSSADHEVPPAIPSLTSQQPTSARQSLNPASAPSSTYTPTITIGGQAYTADSASKYTVGGQTLSPGGPSITFNGVPYSLATSATAIISGTNTMALIQSPSSVPIQLLTIAGNTYSPGHASQYAVGTQTLSPGGSMITINDTPYSLAPSATALVSGMNTIPLNVGPPTEAHNILTIAGKTYTPDSASQYIVGTQTLAPGVAAVTVDGTKYSLPAGGTALISGSSTITLSPGPTATADRGPGRGGIITIGGVPYTENSESNYVIGTQTLRPGGAAITADGTRYFLASAGTALASGISTIPLVLSTGVIALGGAPYANSASAYVVGSQTLVPGGPAITISGTRYALAPAGIALISGSSTIPLQSAAGIVTIDGLSYTANSASAFVIGSQTLRPGATAITVSGGEVVSLGPSGTDVVVGGGRSTTESVGGLGSVIMSGFGPGPTATAPVPSGSVSGNNSASVFLGGASGNVRPKET